jgi:O-acetylhomoserine/O-acetylserine sulfhydrylase-like pyridoxal-dependent enzyme
MLHELKSGDIVMFSTSNWIAGSTNIIGNIINLIHAKGAEIQMVNDLMKSLREHYIIRPIDQ